MHFYWNAVFLCLLLCNLPWAKGQAEPPEEQATFDETFEDDEQPRSFIGQESFTEGVFNFRLPAGAAAPLVLQIPARGTEYPDVLLALDVLLPASNVDIYCLPGSERHTREGNIPLERNYVWKSDHRHGTDYVFISRHHPKLKRFVGKTASGADAAFIVCTVVEQVGISSIGHVAVQLSYETRNVTEQEQDALDNIFQECCQEEERCKAWKKHVAQDNTEAADFCHFNGNFCDESGHLIVLNLNGQNMSCVFPGQELANFQHLEKILMKENSLQGQLNNVLEDVLDLRKVHQLEVSGASFTGDLAEDVTDPNSTVCEIARRGIIEHLDLEDCGITGPLPVCLLDAESMLREIDLYGNQLSGELPSVRLNESRLLTLILGGNQFEGRIPKSWTRFRNVQVLDLSSNQLSGRIPKGFGTARNLQIINLADNQLTGSLPADLLRDTSIESLNISSNQLTGKLPDTFYYGRQLSVLDVHNNSFSGSIPSNLFTAIMLLQLDLSHNQFSGQLSSGLGNLVYLVRLALHNNAFSGPLPASLSQLPLLHEISLQSNAFNGTIPAEWRLIMALHSLRLDDNQLEGEIPSWLLYPNPFYPRFLRVNLTTNQFSSFDPAWYDYPKGASRIIEFRAAHNQIEGGLPHELARQIFLESLDLSGNNITGLLPSEDGDFARLHFLNLSNNALTGEIPELWEKTALFSSAEATTIDLSHNGLSGEIPEFLFLTENSDVDRRFFLKGNRFDYECPLPNELSYIQDLECDENTEGTVESISTSDRDQEEDETRTSSAEVRILSEDGVSNEDAPSISSMKSSSSSTILVPILATIAAVCFAVVVVFLALFVRKRTGSSTAEEAQGDISMTKVTYIEPDDAEETKDHVPMFAGVDSSVAV